MRTYRTPTTAELYSLELRARRMQQEELGRLLRKGALAAKAVLVSAVSQLGAKLSAKVVRHA